MSRRGLSAQLQLPSAANGALALEHRQRPQAGNGENMYQAPYQQLPYMFAEQNPYGAHRQGHIIAQGPGQLQWHQHNQYGVPQQEYGIDQYRDQIQGNQHNEPQHAQIADNSPQLNPGGEHNKVMTRAAFDGIMSGSLRDQKSRANDKIMSNDMKNNIIRELVDGSYTATIQDPKERAQAKHHYRTKYVWVPDNATPQTNDRMSQLCHGITLTRRPGNLYTSELSAKQCLGIKKQLLEMPGRAETGNGEIIFAQAPVTTQESAFSDFCKAHVGEGGRHKGRDATYAALNSGLSDSFSKILVRKLIEACSTCREKFAKASAAGHKAEELRQHTREEKREQRKRSRDEFGEQDDGQQKAVKRLNVGNANEPGQFPLNAEAPVNDKKDHDLPMDPLNYNDYFDQFIVDVWGS